MQRKISYRIFLWETLNPYDHVGTSTAIDRTASNYNDAKEKCKNKRSHWNWYIWWKPCKINTWIARISISGYDRRYWYKRKKCSPLLQGYGTAEFSNFVNRKLLCKS